MYFKKLENLQLQRAMKVKKLRPKKDFCENCGGTIGHTIIAFKGKIICMTCWEVAK